MFNIKQTPYGGRGLFASTPIPKDTLIMKSNPYAHVIYHVFRKEVCGFCFAYSLDGVPRKNTWTIKHCGAWFCSPSCLSEWITEWTVPGTEMISDISVGFERIKRKNSDELTQLELDTSKFVLSALIYQSLHPHQPRTSLLDLQDNEIPYSRVQGDSHIRLIYGFIRQIIQHASPKTRQALSPLIESNERIRELLGRDGNAFGIYDVDGSQILGFGLYISASYFNHNCTPNIKKRYCGREISFHAMRDIEADEELVISYIDTQDPVKKRRDELKKGWFFDCQCLRCLSEYCGG